MILNVIDKIYSSIPISNIFWRSIRYFFRVMANIYVRYVMPLPHHISSNIETNTVIVSLTSFPARIRNVWMTCATLLNQKYTDIHIVLYLTKDEFPHGYDNLPKTLTKLKKRGLDIRIIEDVNLRPHNKYFWALKDFPYNTVITVDDDILYSPKLISELMKIHAQYNDCVICNRGITIKKTNYREWVNNIYLEEKRSDILATGVGGVLYPAHIFDNTPIFDKDAISSTCLNADDLWLSFMTRFKNNKVVQTKFKVGLLTILSSQDKALCISNVGEDRNDEQIRLLSQWAEKKFGFDFFHNCELNSFHL